MYIHPTYPSLQFPPPSSPPSLTHHHLLFHYKRCFKTPKTQLNSERNKAKLNDKTQPLTTAAEAASSASYNTRVEKTLLRSRKVKKNSVQGGCKKKKKVHLTKDVNYYFFLYCLVSETERKRRRIKG